MIPISIDVIIPSFRLKEDLLMPIIGLKKPAETVVNYYVIADNPDASIPGQIIELHKQGIINLIVNEQNLGFSKTRNKGIDAGKSSWILLLDDDIVPDERLLIAYSEQIRKFPDSVGFAGITEFPPPFNSVTMALKLNGVTDGFQSARFRENVYWAPTANIMLNRKKLGTRRFDPSLIISSEDMEFLLRNSLDNDKEPYIGTPEASVTHPWWGNGSMQIKRMFNYGQGLAEVSSRYPVNRYRNLDYTNTSETILILILLTCIAGLLNWNLTFFVILIIAQCFTEFIITALKARKFGNTSNLNIIWQMMLHKNFWEAGRLWGNIKKGRLAGIGERIDDTFSDRSPGSFRLNRWKTIKMITFALLGTLAWVLFR